MTKATFLSRLDHTRSWPHLLMGTTTACPTVGFEWEIPLVNGYHASPLNSANPNAHMGAFDLKKYGFKCNHDGGGVEVGSPVCQTVGLAKSAGRWIRQYANRNTLLDTESGNSRRHNNAGIHVHIGESNRSNADCSAAGVSACMLDRLGTRDFLLEISGRVAPGQFQSCYIGQCLSYGWEDGRKGTLVRHPRLIGEFTTMFFDPVDNLVSGAPLTSGPMITQREALRRVLNHSQSLGAMETTFEEVRHQYAHIFPGYFLYETLDDIYIPIPRTGKIRVQKTKTDVPATMECRVFGSQAHRLPVAIDFARALRDFGHRYKGKISHWDDIPTIQDFKSWVMKQRNLTDLKADPAWALV